MSIGFYPYLELGDPPLELQPRVGRGGFARRGAELRGDGPRQRREAPLEGARVAVRELRPAGVRRVGLALLRELDLAGLCAKMRKSRTLKIKQTERIILGCIDSDLALDISRRFFNFQTD